MLNHSVQVVLNQITNSPSHASSRIALISNTFGFLVVILYNIHGKEFLFPIPDPMLSSSIEYCLVRKIHRVYHLDEENFISKFPITHGWLAEQGCCQR